MCLSVHPSFCIYQVGLLWTDFHEILLKYHKNPICAKSENRIRHFTWRPRYVGTVDSNMKYFLAQRQYRGNQLLRFQGLTQQLYIVSSGMWLSSESETHCCIFMATLSMLLYPVTCSSTIHNTRLWTYSWWPWVQRHLDCLESDDISWIAVAVGVWTRIGCSGILPSSSGSHFNMPHLSASSCNGAGCVGRRAFVFIVFTDQWVSLLRLQVLLNIDRFLFLVKQLSFLSPF